MNPATLKNDIKAILERRAPEIRRRLDEIPNIVNEWLKINRSSNIGDLTEFFGKSKQKCKIKHDLVSLNKKRQTVATPQVKRQKKEQDRAPPTPQQTLKKGLKVNEKNKIF